MIEGDTELISATVSPSNANNKSVIWSSNNAAVAKVENGLVSAINAGEAIITAKSDDGGKTATCIVTVSSKTIAVQSITLNKDEIVLTEGGVHTISVSFIPENATNKNVSWSSSDFNVATVENGKITAIKAGEAVITVTSEDCGKTATCKVAVLEKTYPVESVSLDKTSIDLTEGAEAILSATILPENATNKNLIWYSTNEDVATVKDGVVKAQAKGYAEITVTTEDGNKTATCKVTVLEKTYPVESVYLEKTAIDMTEGEETTITATVLPENATNKNVSWTSDNQDIATVESGKVKALKPGETLITVKTEDGGKTASCKVSVIAKEYHVESVSLDITSLSLLVGEEACLNATILPENATNKTVSWSSNNPSVATVSEGVVSAISIGDAIVTVMTEDGSKTATCKIVVDKEINFDDPKVEQICITHWDSNKDGKLSYSEAAAVTNFSDAFAGSDISSFNEYEYFVNMTTGSGLPGIFEDCKYLKSIKLPLTLTTISRKMFDGCTQLSEIVMHEGIKEIKSSAFANCSSLKSITIPSSVRNIDNFAFFYCTSLLQISVPANVESLGEEAFCGCSSLAKAELLSRTLNEIPEGLFDGCKRLTSVTIISDYKSIGAHAFSDCSSLPSISIKESVTFIGEDAFSCCHSIKEIIIPRNVTYIGDCAFHSCYAAKSIKCLAANPPTIGLTVFGNTRDCDILVPDESVNAYKNAEGWNVYSSRIKGISDSNIEDPTIGEEW